MSKLLSVEDALHRILDHAQKSLTEIVPIDLAHGRVLAEDLAALRTQPPFSASAMDGYAVRASDIEDPPCILNMIGESAAGHGYDGAVNQGETVRIFTGAPLPKGTDTISIQENVETDGSLIKVMQSEPLGRFVRPAGLDFSKGDIGLSKDSVLGAAEISLAASMNHPEVPVKKRPAIAVISSGDELVAPGTELAKDQIISSNSYGVVNIINSAGGDALDLGIADDTLAALEEKFSQANECDVVVTLGGASVGDHDLVQQALKLRGIDLNFWSLAMKPGKPVMFGTLTTDDRTQIYLGLPGNPVSSLVCAMVFVAPLIKKMLGLPPELNELSAFLSANLPASGPRQEYMRASSVFKDGKMYVAAFDNQDSSILSNLVKADCLIVRPANAEAAKIGEECKVLML